MPQPTPYNRGHDFKDDHLDAELDDISLSIGEVIENLAIIQRDDGRLANGSVTPDTLSHATKQMIGNWNVRGEWTAGMVYAVKDAVTVDGALYVCLVRHVASVFADESANWVLVSDASLSTLAGDSGAGLVGVTGGGTVQESLDSKVATVDLAAAGGAGLVGYAAEGGVARTVAEKLSEVVSVKDFGAVGDGVTDDLAKLQTFSADSAGFKLLPDGSYYLSAEWRPAPQNFTMLAGAGVEFVNGRPDLRDLIPYQNGEGDIWSQHIISKTYGAPWVDYGNIFQIASYAKADTVGPPVVAVFGEGEAAADGSKAWGGNFVAYASHATGTSIGIELNCGVLAAGGLAYGLVIASSGDGGQVQNAIQVQSNRAESQFINGLRFFWRSDERGLLTGNALYFDGAAGATCERLIFAEEVTATLAEIDFPSFVVEATQPGTVNRLAMRGAAAGGAPLIRANGADANITIGVRGKGSGGVSVQDGSGAEKFRANASGISFFGKGAVPQVSWEAPTGSALRTTFDTSTVTVEELAKRVKAIIDDLTNYGLYG